ncbi:thiosulfate oxidation carrier protein SoxY [Roseivivax sediminis]|uniref:Sulfur-oxidizing protein SoxY n=1 Tax=Roseivivax sediminis TaxID=936889 RepID=A0A1I2D1P8_9RHOB|nr:thiosulfate oxidation carrier protein SoxY [Roseivivax sediminis]SFE74477.1 sulfur-oxidizing protein SoxY [Roseivivax sediminis]
MRPISRRTSLALGLGAAAGTAFGEGAATKAEAAIAAFTGGANIAPGDVTLILPEIAENGFTVPIEVAAPGAEAILVLAPANPNPEVATFTFGPLSGAQRASTRIRLAQSQEVIAIARMDGGRYIEARRSVEVTLGGCGAPT